MYPARDANFNVTALIDTGGTVQERYFYDPYGKRTILDGSWGARGSSSYDWTLGHQGLMLDAETGLYYNRARMLHATLGRFVQRDYRGYIDGPSVYGYLRSSPLTLVDPEGLKAKECPPGQHPEPKKGYTPKTNGCGPDDWRNKLVPDNPFWFRFKQACDAHDICYGSCNKTQEYCDEEFRTDMRAACWLQFGWLSIKPMPKELELQLKACYATAELYAKVVRNHGEAAHSAGQDDACECCDDLATTQPSPPASQPSPPASSRDEPAPQPAPEPPGRGRRHWVPDGWMPPDIPRDPFKRHPLFN